MPLKPAQVSSPCPPDSWLSLSWCKPPQLSLPSPLQLLPREWSTPVPQVLSQMVPTHADNAFVPQGLWLQSCWTPEPGREQSQWGQVVEGTFLVFSWKRNLHLTIFKAQPSVLLLPFVILFLLQHLSLFLPILEGWGNFYFTVYSNPQSDLQFSCTLEKLNIHSTYPKTDIYFI